MRRGLAAALIAAALLAGTTTNANAGVRWTHCRYRTVFAHDGWDHREVHMTLRCALEHWPVPGGFSYAHYISERESGDRATARNTSSGACGIYQSLPSLWPRRINWFRRVSGWRADPSCYNARSNVLWAIRYAHAYGWGPWSG